MGFPLNIPLSGADILTTTSDKRHPFGTRGVTRDGRSFRYARNGTTALIPGLVVQSSVPVNEELLLDTGTTKMKANSSQIRLIASATSPFGDTSVVVNYDDGYIWAYGSNTAKGAAHYVQIKSHSKGLTATKNVLITFDLVEGDAFYSHLDTFGTTAAKFGLIRNPYDKVVVKPASTLTSIVVGVPVRPVAASYYFWLQTWGPCPVRANAVATKIGRPVGVDTGTAVGRVQGLNTTKNTSAVSALITYEALQHIIAGVGVQMLVAVSGEYRMINLTIAP